MSRKKNSRLGSNQIPERGQRVQRVRCQKIPENKRLAKHRGRPKAIKLFKSQTKQRVRICTYGKRPTSWIISDRRKRPKAKKSSNHRKGSKFVEEQQGKVMSKRCHRTRKRCKFIKRLRSKSSWGPRRRRDFSLGRGVRKIIH